MMGWYEDSFPHYAENGTPYRAILDRMNARDSLPVDFSDRLLPAWLTPDAMLRDLAKQVVLAGPHLLATALAANLPNAAQEAIVFHDALIELGVDPRLPTIVPDADLDLAPIGPEDHERILPIVRAMTLARRVADALLVVTLHPGPMMMIERRSDGVESALSGVESALNVPPIAVLGLPLDSTWWTVERVKPIQQGGLVLNVDAERANALINCFEIRARIGKATAVSNVAFWQHGRCLATQTPGSAYGNNGEEYLFRPGALRIDVPNGLDAALERRGLP